MHTRLVTPPAVEPVTLTEAKLHLRLAVTEADAVLYTAEDAKITGLIIAAREYVETFTRRAIITQTWDAVMPCFPDGYYLPLPMPDLQTVTSISYFDSAGDAATFTGFTVSLARNSIKKNYAAEWPEIYPESEITIRYVCGYGLAVAVPFSIKAAILLIVGHLHKNTEATVGAYGVEFSNLPLGVESLLAGFRRFEF